jgi:hypothetical protein
MSHGAQGRRMADRGGCVWRWQEGCEGMRQQSDGEMGNAEEAGEAGEAGPVGRTT